MDRAGAFAFGGALHGPDAATVVPSGTGLDKVTTDGPFVEAKEHIGGSRLCRHRLWRSTEPSPPPRLRGRRQDSHSSTVSPVRWTATTSCVRRAHRCWRVSDARMRQRKPMLAQPPWPVGGRGLLPQPTWRRASRLEAALELARPTETVKRAGAVHLRRLAGSNMNAATSLRGLRTTTSGRTSTVMTSPSRLVPVLTRRTRGSTARRCRSRRTPPARTPEERPLSPRGLSLQISGRPVPLRRGQVRQAATCLSGSTPERKSSPDPASAPDVHRHVAARNESAVTGRATMRS